MSTVWPNVRLGDVLTPISRSESVKPTSEYSLLGVRLNGNGPYHRETVLGAKSSAAKLNRVCEGDFIYSRLFACRGAFGVIGKELDGHYVSADFPTFVADATKIDVQFLRSWFRLPAVIASVDKDCAGSTPITRNRFKDRFFLGLQIPLPALAEQHRIVARIQGLEARLAEAKTLRGQATEEAQALSASLLFAFLPHDLPTKQLSELIHPESTISYGVLVPGPDVEDGVPFVRVQDLSVENAAAFPNKKIAPHIDKQYSRTRLRGGEILIGVVGSIGKVGIAPATWAGANIARAVCRIVPSEEVNTDYLAAVLSAKPCQDFFRESTRTLAQPTLNVAQLAKTPIPVPSLHDQRRIMRYLDDLSSRVEALKFLQAETAKDLDALGRAILDQAFKGAL